MLTQVQRFIGFVNFYYVGYPKTYYRSNKKEYTTIQAEYYSIRNNEENKTLLYYRTLTQEIWPNKAYTYIHRYLRLYSYSYTNAMV